MTCLTNRTYRLTLLFAIMLAISQGVLLAETETNAMAQLSFDELMVHIQRYGSTEAKRKLKHSAKNELSRREGAAIVYLMDHIEIENMWIKVMADTLCDTLPEETVTPALLPYLAASSEQARKYAAYWLGFHSAPEYAAMILPLLQDETTAGAAIRTLGKWQIADALPAIFPYLAHDKERLRILAVNALRDIGADGSIPDLIAATGDPVFTVRKAASRALESYGKKALKQILAAIPDAESTSRRELISVLGSIPAGRSVRFLRRLLKEENPFIRDTAARALLNIEPVKAREWLTDAEIPADRLVLPH